MNLSPFYMTQDFAPTPIQKLKFSVAIAKCTMQITQVFCDKENLRQIHMFYNEGCRPLFFEV